jgi:exopolysaccharide/PEP-CTERM locus tyrosine autokinase
VIIDVAALRSAGLLPPEGEDRGMAEQFRQIKRPLIVSAIGRGAPRLAAGHLIMIASAVPSEGKTFTTLNLAISMAYERDVHVLLIDGDVAKPHLTRALGLASEPGLLDALRDSSIDVESLILATDVPGLAVLPAGQQGPHATELLASARMLEIVRSIGERDTNRIVLFDSPPLLLTSESFALTAAVGQVLLVVRSGVTPQQAVLDAIERIGPDRPTSVVLNQTMSHVRGEYRYYGSNYGRVDPNAT